MALTTRANVKLALNISADDTSSDDRVDLCVSAADAAVKGYCHRDLESTSYTEFYTGSGRSRLLLNQYPVTSITSVYLDLGGYFGEPAGSFPSSALLTAGVDYVLDRKTSGRSDTGFLLRLGAGQGYGSGLAWTGGLGGAGFGGGTLTGGRSGPVWPAVPGCLKISYVAGYATVPDDLSMAATELSCWLWRNMERGGVGMQSENLGQYGYSVASQSLSAAPELGSTRQLLARYRRIVL